MKPTEDINPNVEHVAISKLRNLNASKLRIISAPLVVHTNNTPLAVLMRYEHFLSMQTQLQSLLDTIETIATKEEFAALAGQLHDVQLAARTKALNKINAFYARTTTDEPPSPAANPDILDGTQ